MEIPQLQKVKFVSNVMNDLRRDLELFLDVKRCRILSVLALHPSPIERTELAELSGLDPTVGETGRLFQELESRGYIVPVDPKSKPVLYLITTEGRELAETIIGTFFFAAESRLDDPKWRPHRDRLLEFCRILRHSLQELEPSAVSIGMRRISGRRVNKARSGGAI